MISEVQSVSISSIFQEVISKMTLQGPVDNEVLQEMGLTLHTDPQGNTIKMVPLSRG